jgi:patatin-like phospholipase/acyl hydrolase
MVATRPIRVLSIDGGGIRGYLPAIVLAEIERRAGKPVGQLFDLIVGTSTGAIIGIGVAAGQSAAELAEFYPRYGRKIFGGTDDRTAFQKRLFGSGATLRESLDRAARSIGDPFGGNPRFGGNARHQPGHLEAVLDEVLGEKTLADVETELAVTTFDGLTSHPVVMSSRDARTDPSRNVSLAQAARATSAAPTYFPPLSLNWGGQPREFVDGGVWANNPAGVAVIESLHLTGTAGVTGSSVTMVSLGTGVVPGDSVLGANTSWLGTAKDLTGLATSVWAGEVMAQRALGDRYVRFQVEDARIAGAMDDPSTQRLDQLKSAADGLLKEKSDLLDSVISTLAT